MNRGSVMLVMQTALLRLQGLVGPNSGYKTTYEAFYCGFVHCCENSFHLLSQWCLLFKMVDLIMKIQAAAL